MKVAIILNRETKYSNNKFQVLIFPLAFFQFPLWSVKTAKPTIRQILFFFLFFLFFFFFVVVVDYHYLVVWPRLDEPFVSQNLREFCASRFPGRILDCTYTIFSYGQMLASSTIPRGSPCITSWLYSLMGLIDSALSPHNLHLLFCCLVYFCFDIVSPYGVVLCCYRKRFRFSLKVFFSKKCPSFLV